MCVFLYVNVLYKSNNVEYQLLKGQPHEILDKKLYQYLLSYFLWFLICSSYDKEI